jgi:hypothetical protein
MMTIVSRPVMARPLAKTGWGRSRIIVSPRSLRGIAARAKACIVIESAKRSLEMSMVRRVVPRPSWAVRS